MPSVAPIALTAATTGAGPARIAARSASRDRLVRRTLHDLGNTLTGRPRDIVLLCSQHYCRHCRKYFNADSTDLADPGSHYTRRVVNTAVRLVVEDGLPYRVSRMGPLARPPRVRPLRHDPELGRGRGGKRRRGGSTPTISTGRSPTSRASSPSTSCMTGRSASCRSSTTAPSSGSPTKSSITTRPTRTSRPSSAGSRGPHGARADRSRGSRPTARRCIPSRLPRSSVRSRTSSVPSTSSARLTKAILSAVAKERKRLAASAPKLPRGRPRATKAAGRAARRKKRIAAEGRRSLRSPLPVRPEASESLRACDVAADQPRASPSSASCAS